MDANQIFSIGLGLESPWRIVTSHLDVNVNPHRLDLRIEPERGALYPCPDCGRMCKAHDFAERLRQQRTCAKHCFAQEGATSTSSGIIALGAKRH